MAMSSVSPSVQPALSQLTSALSGVCADWYGLGVQLGIDSGKLAAIENNKHHVVEHCMMAMLEKWQQTYPERGWHDIVAALKRIDRNDVALNVDKVYCNTCNNVGTPELEASPLSLASPLPSQLSLPPSPLSPPQGNVVTTKIPKNVVKKLEKIEDEFYQLVSKIKEELRDRLVDQKGIARLASFCSSILQIKHFHCSNIDDLFTHLQPHLHFLNYSLLNRIDRTYLSRATKPDIKRYKAALKKFTKSTTIAQFKSAIEQLHPSPSRDPSSTTVQLKTKDTWSSCTVYNVDRLIKYLFPGHKDSVILVGIHHSVLTIACTAPTSAILCLTTLASKRLPIIKAVDINIISIQIGPLLMIVRDDLQAGTLNFENLLFEIIDQPYIQYTYTARVIKLLVYLGADINAQMVSVVPWLTLDGSNTAIMFSCVKAYTPIVKLLLRYNPDVNMQNNAGMTALMHCCSIKNASTRIEIVKLLLKHGVNINVDIVDKNQHTALAFATHKGYIEMVNALLQHGAELNKQNVLGKTALLDAVYERHLNIAKLLLIHGANPNIYDNEGMAPLQQVDNIDLVKLLLQHGADPNVICNGLTALTKVSGAGLLDIVNELLQHGANPNLYGYVRHHPFGPLYAVTTNVYNGIEIAKALLSNGADVNLQERVQGRTPLMYAVMKGNQEIVELYLEYGARVTTTDAMGRTALVHAIEKGKNEVAKILIPKALQELANTPQPPPPPATQPAPLTPDPFSDDSTISFSDRADRVKVYGVFPTLKHNIFDNIH